MAPLPWLLLIIFLEGYVVLSTELLAIRLMLPFTGSGTDTVSIIIAAILMPLAFGYAAGGSFRPGSKPGGVRKRLIRNLVVAALILTPGLSYVFLNNAFEFVQNHTSFHNRLGVTALYAAVFLVYPVFLLGQTVPLVSNYFSKERLSAMAGRILFVSTLGSFMGAVFCTLVLMTWIGVHHTVTISIACMTALVFILSRRKLAPQTLLMLALLALALWLNGEPAMKRLNVVSDNLYNVAQIEEHDDGSTRVLKLNRTNASAVYTDSDAPRLLYAKLVERTFIDPIRNNADEPKKILILGAGGFTLGRTDDKNAYTYVDLDKNLKDVAETWLLQEKIGANKRFIAMEARAFLNQTHETYDMIMLDLYRDPISAPEYLVTEEFYNQVRAHLKNGGLMVGNYFASPNFSDNFSIRLDNTLRAVFRNLNRAPVKPYNGWERENDWMNIVYSAVNHPDASEVTYTDNQNLSLFDKPVLLHTK